MNIRKQLDGLIKGNEDDMGHTFHYSNGVMEAVRWIREFEKENIKYIKDDDTRKLLEQNFDLLIRDLERYAQFEVDDDDISQMVRDAENRVDY